ncbi:hypothetical protein [Amphibacillus sediminis]|uniref:hypothetical protein n=1 Tax=Amphibacillus sediminis TaxID=360185 RepID=UPI000832384A|nr:hypothetical protein [Amphibacillus sediminis]
MSTFLLIVFGIPIYILLIWTFIEPEEAYLFGRRWQYNRTPELSDLAISWIRTGSVFAMIIYTILIIFSFF